MPEFLCLPCFYVLIVLFGSAMKINDAYDSKMPSFHQFQSCIPYALNVQMKTLINNGVVIRRMGERDRLPPPSPPPRKIENYV